MSRTAWLVIEVTVDDGADLIAVADEVFDLLVEDDTLPEALESIDGIDARWEQP